MTRKVVRNHSHWGAFLAEVKDGRIVGVRSFERDPDPSTLIGAIPTAVHSTTRIDQPMVREGWLARGQGNGEGRGRGEPRGSADHNRRARMTFGEADAICLRRG